MVWIYLQTNHVGLVLQDFLDNQVLAVLPGECLFGTAHKSIVVLTESYILENEIQLDF